MIISKYILKLLKYKIDPIWTSRFISNLKKNWLSHSIMLTFRKFYLISQSFIYFFLFFKNIINIPNNQITSNGKETPESSVIQFSLIIFLLQINFTTTNSLSLFLKLNTLILLNSLLDSNKLMNVYRGEGMHTNFL